MTARPRTRARKGEGDQLRGEILVAAEELLRAAGSAEAVSVRAIADRVGCTSPAIYLHWKHKNDIFTELCSTRFGEFSSRVMAGLDADGSVLERLADVARAYIRYAQEHPEHYRVLFMGPVGPPAPDAPPTAGALAFGLVVGVLQAGIDAGEIRPLDPVEAAAALFAGIHGVASLIVDSHEDVPIPDAPDLVEAFVDITINGIAVGRQPAIEA